MGLSKSERNFKKAEEQFIFVRRMLYFNLSRKSEFVIILTRKVAFSSCLGFFSLKGKNELQEGRDYVTQS